MLEKMGVQSRFEISGTIVSAGPFWMPEEMEETFTMMQIAS